MSNRHDETVEVDGTIEAETRKAVLFAPLVGSKDEVWIPKSQIVERFENDDSVTLVITEWIARKNGLD